jgi:DnaJ like chaperone protein
MGEKFGRLLAGAGIGFLFGGPFGAILGALLAGGLDTHSQTFTTEAPSRERFLFYSSLVSLLTLVAKADDHVSPEEARTIADFFKHDLHFGEQELSIVRRLMKETLRINPPPEAIAADFARISSIEERLALMRLIWMVAVADGRIDRREEQVINRIASSLGIDANSQRGIAAEFRKAGSRNYETLGVTPEASNSEIKEAYKRMAKQYHPDRVAHLGEEYSRLAHEKFAQINAAYDDIRKERGF